MFPVPLWLRRALVSLLLLYHLLAVGAALLKDVPPIASVRRYTRDYERLVGVYQGWNMFAPNPPRVDTWMHLTGTRGDGAVVALRPLVGARDTVWLEPRYLRAGKLERNLLTESRARALRDFARQQCAQQPGLERITVTHVKRHSPTPTARQQGAVPSLTQTVVAEVACTAS